MYKSSEESNQRISESLKRTYEMNKEAGIPHTRVGKTHSEESKILMSEARKNLVWLNNGVVSIRVKPENVEEWESQGYTEGMVKRVGR